MNNVNLEKHFGLIIFFPVFILSCLFARYIPSVVGAATFVICFIVFLMTAECYTGRKTFFKATFVLLVFCSIHFWGYCVTTLDPTEYDGISEEKTAEAVSWVIYLPLAFIFAFLKGIVFDKWRK